MNIAFDLSSASVKGLSASAREYTDKVVKRLSDSIGARSVSFFRPDPSVEPASFQRELQQFIGEHNIELLIIPSPFGTPYPDMITPGVLGQAKLAVVVHDFLPLRPDAASAASGTEQPDVLTRFGARLALISRADLLWTNLEMTRLEAALYAGIAPSRVHVIRAGIDDVIRPLETVDRGMLAHQYGISGRFVLASGAMAYRDNQEAAAAAFAEVNRQQDKPLQLVWLDLDAGERERMRCLSEQSGTAAQLVMIGGELPAEELVRLYNGAEMLLFPARYEGFAFPPLLAMACGTPVLAADNETMRELCGGAARYTDASNVSAIADAMTAMLGSPDPAAREKGFAIVRRYRWERVVRAAARSLETLQFSVRLHPSRFWRGRDNGRSACLFSFPQNSLPRHTKITGAVLQLPVLAGSEVRVYGIRHDWRVQEPASMLRLLHDPAPVYSGIAAGEPGAPRQSVNVDWNCSDLVKRWAADPSLNHGFGATGLHPDEPPLLEIRYAYHM